ncbi:hypothetical protein BKA65DRAFT_502669 [Rhexocercosporidium sp. MPI-PUGE-AT-0058]|nr:hypothetical protein BKA65DRAFT_502669 [Rhexocercosporidium sp. MPI-PUGE-AT-0058]
MLVMCHPFSALAISLKGTLLGVEGLSTVNLNDNMVKHQTRNCSSYTVVCRNCTQAPVHAPLNGFDVVSLEAAQPRICMDRLYEISGRYMESLCH